MKKIDEKARDKVLASTPGEHRMFAEDVMRSYEAAKSKAGEGDAVAKLKALSYMANSQSNSAQEVVALEHVLKLVEALTDHEAGWRSIESAPKDGTAFYVRYKTPMRFLPYSHKSQEYKRGYAGRWQMMNEYGGWENTDASPYEWQPHESDMKPPASLRTEEVQEVGE